MLDTNLITKALQLTGKTMEDMEEIESEFLKSDIMNGSFCAEPGDLYLEFSIEKLCYYLLSPEFIEKYIEICAKGHGEVWYEIGDATYEYQRRDELYPNGNEQPLIDLLTKIK